MSVLRCNGIGKGNNNNKLTELSTYIIYYDTYSTGHLFEEALCLYELIKLIKTQFLLLFLLFILFFKNDLQSSLITAC